jgi:hypothetical protein
MNIELQTLFGGLVAAERHADGLRCLRIFEVDAGAFAALRADVIGLCRDERPSDAARPGHVTSWTRPRGEVLQFSLLNESGRFDDFSRDHDASCRGKRFHAAAVYPALARFVAAFPDTVNFRINILGPRSGLPPHEEHTLIRTRSGGVGARLRFHLPVVTNAAAELTLDGDVVHLDASVCHFVNHGCVHGASNGHATESRIHLSWDMLLTRETFACMFGDRLPDFPVRRIAVADGKPAVLRVERTEAYERLAPDVPPNDARLLNLCDPQ